MTNGSHILEKDPNKIALDYSYSQGNVDGILDAIEMIEDIASIVEEETEVDRD